MLLSQGDSSTEIPDSPPLLEIWGFVFFSLLGSVLCLISSCLRCVAPMATCPSPTPAWLPHPCIHLPSSWNLFLYLFWFQLLSLSTVGALGVLGSLVVLGGATAVGHRSPAPWCSQGTCLWFGEYPGQEGGNVQDPILLSRAVAGAGV